MSKHTPGPWSMTGVRSRIMDPDTTFHFIEAGETCIAAVPYSDRTIQEHLASLADGRLIAAAPDLYEALDPDTLDAVAEEIDCFEHSARAHSLRVIAKAQRAALAKAGGKEE